MSERRKSFLYRPELEDGGYPEECPFNTSRAGRTLRTAESMGLLAGSDREVVPPQALSRADAERFHKPAYIDALQRAGAADDATGSEAG